MQLVKTITGEPVLKALITAQKLNAESRTSGQRYLVEFYEHFVNKEKWDLYTFLCSVAASNFWRIETEAGAFA